MFLKSIRIYFPPFLQSLGVTASTHRPTHKSVTFQHTFLPFVCPDRAEEERAAIADTNIEGLENRLEAAALREEHLRAELKKPMRLNRSLLPSSRRVSFELLLLFTPSMYSQGRSGIPGKHSLAPRKVSIP